MTHATTAAFAIALLLAGDPARAQSGGAYDLRHNTVDGGGATFSSSAAYSLGGTIGQPDAGRLSGGSYSLSGGFWVDIQGPPPTPTPTAIATATVSFSASPSPSRPSTGTVAPTATPSHTPMSSAIATPTRTATPTIATTGTPTETPTPSPSPAESPNVTPAAACAGDCNLDDVVTIAELLRLVNVALGVASVETCSAGDANRDGLVRINELLQAVTSALTGCD